MCPPNFLRWEFSIAENAQLDLYAGRNTRGFAKETGSELKGKGKASSAITSIKGDHYGRLEILLRIGENALEEGHRERMQARREIYTTIGSSRPLNAADKKGTEPNQLEGKVREGGGGVRK